MQTHFSDRRHEIGLMTERVTQNLKTIMLLPRTSSCAIRGLAFKNSKDCPTWTAAKSKYTDLSKPSLYPSKLYDSR
eukprot:3935705-Rhodomonas_salina.1